MSLAERSLRIYREDARLRQPMAEALDQLTLPASGTDLDEATIRDDVKWLLSENEQESANVSTRAR